MCGVHGCCMYACMRVWDVWVYGVCMGIFMHERVAYASIDCIIVRPRDCMHVQGTVNSRPQNSTQPHQIRMLSLSLSHTHTRAHVIPIPILVIAFCSCSKDKRKSISKASTGKFPFENDMNIT